VLLDNGLVFTSVFASLVLKNKGWNSLGVNNNSDHVNYAKPEMLHVIERKSEYL